MKKFLDTIYNTNDNTWIDSIVSLRNRLVVAGKTSDKFIKYAKVNGKKGLKWDDPKNTSIAGSIANEDAILLYLIIKKYKPKNILEIGTWFGTSAYIIAQAMKDNGINGRVYTCDKHDLFLDLEEYRNMVEYYNVQSDKFIKKMIRHGLKIDMAFVDARLSPENIRDLMGMYRGRIVYTNHDWLYDKGMKNLEYAKKLLGGSVDYILPPENNAIITMDDGQKINYCTYLILGK